MGGEDGESNTVLSLFLLILYLGAWHRSHAGSGYVGAIHEYESSPISPREKVSWKGKPCEARVAMCFVRGQAFLESSETPMDGDTRSPTLNY
jgi:hypothetical protein